MVWLQAKVSDGIYCMLYRYKLETHGIRSPWREGNQSLSRCSCWYKCGYTGTALLSLEKAVPGINWTAPGCLWTTLFTSFSLHVWHQQTRNDRGLLEQAWPKQDRIHWLSQQRWALSTVTLPWYHGSGSASRHAGVTKHAMLLMNLIKRRSQNPGDT